LTRDAPQPTLTGGSIWIDLRGIQEGTHSLVLDGRESALVVEEEADRVLRGFRFDGEVAWDGRDYRVRGSLTGDLESACDRCLVRFARPVTGDVDFRAVPPDSPEGEGARPEEAAVLLGTDRRLDLAGPLRGAVLLELPIKSLCRDDCAGICPVCGVNRNLGSCDCEPSSGDPRWEALRGLSFPKEEE
jgi:uncharacterized protein